MRDDDEAVEPVILDNDDQDSVAQTRPLPEADPVDAARASPEQMPTIGHVGRYALKYCIGEGGLGTVYAAHDPLLSRLIAIKTMHVNLPEQDREQFNALFLNEAKAAGSLSHPHIVTVFDAGAGSQGTYIAMELLRGKDLRQLLAVGWRPTPAQAALIVRRVADALSYAHHKGVIHRDIKPANIFMVGRTQPRVLDFGIARIRQVEAQMPSEDGLSRFGDLVGGSPHYMAPEQVRREPVDRRGDVYSLGVVFYELLTGRKPFSGQDLDEIANAVLTQQPPAPHEVNPEVPVALSEIAMRAMARDLVQRTRSARTLSQELREWLSLQGDDPSIQSRRSSKGSKSSKPPGNANSTAAGAQAGQTAVAARGRFPVAVTALAVLGVALTGGALWWAFQRPPESAVVATSAPAAPVGTAAPRPVSTAPVAPPVAASGSASLEATAGAPAPQPPAPALVAATGSPEPAPTPAAQPAMTPPQASPSPAPVVATVERADTRPVPTGTVRVAVTPWGRVFVGRKSMGVTPPLTQFPLPQGRHTITIRNDDAPAFQQTIEVKAGESVTVTHAF